MTRLIDADTLMLDIVEAGQANKGGRYKIGDFWELNGAEIRTVVDAQPTIELPSHSGLIGWVCPVCGRGLSPFTYVCPCQGGKGWEITCG